MNLQVEKTTIPGCYELIPRVLDDDRGSFVKTFHSVAFRELGLRTDWAEQYYTVSNPYVLRGLHFQIPPHDHVKLVYCVSGSVLDVVVDIRKNSPTFGQHVEINLSAQKGNMIYIESGLAHGFCTRDSIAMMVYNVSSVYEPTSDAGIRWDSLDISWPHSDYLMSERDCAFPALANFDSPFDFQTNSD